MSASQQAASGASRDPQEPHPIGGARGGAADQDQRATGQRQPPLRTPVDELDMLDSPALGDPPDGIGKVRKPGRSQLRPSVMLFVGAQEQPPYRLPRGLIEVAQYPGHDM